jgi:hypothetical protein
MQSVGIRYYKEGVIRPCQSTILNSPDGPKIDARYEGQQPYITKRGCEILMSKCTKLRDKNFIKTFAADLNFESEITVSTCT